MDIISIAGTIIGLLASIVALYTFLSGKTHLKNKKGKYDHKLSISGEWNEEKAKNLVLKEMENFGDYKKYGFSGEGSFNVKHNIYKVFYIPYLSNKKSYVIVGYTQQTENGDIVDCHACSVRLSIFEFLHDDGKWVLATEFINIANTGSWGEPPDIKAMEIGYNIFGIIIEEGYTAQGLTSMQTSIYANVADSYKMIFSDATSEDNSEGYCANWSSSINFDKQGSSFYDMTVIKKGKIEDYNGDCVDIDERIIYKFDGSEYSKSRVYN